MKPELFVVFDGTLNRPMGRYLFGHEEPPPAPMSAPLPPKVYTPKPAPEVYTGLVGQIRDALMAQPQTAHDLSARKGWPSYAQTLNKLYRLQVKGLVKVVARRQFERPVFGHKTEAVWGWVTT